MSRRWGTWAGAGALALAVTALAYVGWQRYRAPKEAVYGGKTREQWLEALDAGPVEGRAAADALARLGEEGLPVLLEARKSSDLSTHRLAAWALVRVGAPSAPGLVSALPQAGDRAETALVRLGADAVPALVEGLRDARTAPHAARALGLIGARARAAEPALVALLQDRGSDRTARSEAARALGRVVAYRAESGPGLDALCGALADREEEVKLSAVEALWRVASPAPEAVRALAAATRDEGRLVARGACLALGRAGPSAAPVLAQRLRDAEGVVRQGTVLVLANLGPDARPALPALVSSLAGKEESRAAREALARLGPVGVPALIAALGDADASIRRAAAEVLGELGVWAQDAGPALSGHQDDDALVGVAVLEALPRCDPGRARPVVPSLVCLLAGDQPEGAVRALAALGPDAAKAAPALLDVVRRSGGSGRAAAIALMALVAMGDRAVPALVDALGPDDPDTRVVVTLALTHAPAGVAARRQVPRLLGYLKDRRRAVQAAIALARIDPSRAGEIVRALVPLDAPVQRVPAGVAMALGELGPKARDAVGFLRAGLGAGGREALPVVRALGRIGPPSAPAATALTGLLSEGDPDVARAAADSLVSIGPGAVPALSAALASPSLRVRGAAAHALGRVGPGARAAVAELIKALADSEDSVRLLAGEALGRIGPPAADAVMPLVGWLGDWQADRRRVAVTALAGIGRPARSAVPFLAECLLDPDPAVRAGAASALARVGAPAGEVEDDLLGALDDGDDLVRLAAAEALAKLAPARRGRVAAVLTEPALAALPGPQVAAAEVLARVDVARARALVPALESHARAPASPQQVRAARLLVKLAPARAPLAARALADALNAGGTEERLEAARALGEMGPAARGVLPFVRLAAVGDRDDGVRAAARAAVRRIDGLR